MPAQTPTFGELLTVLRRDFGVTVDTSQGISGPRGDVDIMYLKRRMSDGSLRVASLQDHHNGDQLHPRVVRSICRQLGVPVDAFGEKQPDSYKVPPTDLPN